MLGLPDGAAPRQGVGRDDRAGAEGDAALGAKWRECPCQRGVTSRASGALTCE